MKVSLATIWSIAVAASAVGVHGNDASGSTNAVAVSNDASRGLQNYNYYGNGGGYGGYENYEEYVRYQMSQRLFTFTGCSTVQGSYGWNSVYVTFRLCDKCKANRNMGCDSSNGDYVVSMAQFGETFSEYWQEMTYNQDRNAAPFACTKIDEYAEAQLYQQYYNQNNYNQGGGGGGGGQQEWYNNNQVEYFVGPVCDGGKTIRTGLFYDEDCTNTVEGTTLADVLGFEPSDTNAQPPVCVPCMQTNYNNGGGGEAELNPLCDRMLEEAGRCDRTRRQTNFDTYWQNNMQQGGGGGGENRYNYGNACGLIDSLKHMKTAKRRRTAMVSTLWILLAASVVAVGMFAHKKGYLSKLPTSIKFAWPKKNKTQYADSDYHREDGAMT